MKKTFIGLILLSALNISVSAQKFIFPHFSGFKLVTDYTVFVPENLWDFITGAADTYLAYEFVDLHVAEYNLMPYQYVDYMLLYQLSKR